jgi:hypothetical protein
MNIGAQAIESARSTWPSSDELGWFAVRQPGVLGVLAQRFPGDDDALAVALATSWRIFEAYRSEEGLPSPRIDSELLGRALFAVVREIAGPVGYDGIASRQPDLGSFVYRVLADPPYPLSRAQECVLAQTLWALIYALDEVVNGRPVP